MWAAGPHVNVDSQVFPIFFILPGGTSIRLHSSSGGTLTVIVLPPGGQRDIFQSPPRGTLTVIVLPPGGQRDIFQSPPRGRNERIRPPPRGHMNPVLVPPGGQRIPGENVILSLSSPGGHMNPVLVPPGGQRIPGENVILSLSSPGEEYVRLSPPTEGERMTVFPLLPSGGNMWKFPLFFLPPGGTTEIRLILTATPTVKGLVFNLGAPDGAPRLKDSSFHGGRACSNQARAHRIFPKPRLRRGLGKIRCARCLILTAAPAVQGLVPQPAFLQGERHENRPFHHCEGETENVWNPLYTYGLGVFTSSSLVGEEDVKTSFSPRGEVGSRLYSPPGDHEGKTFKCPPGEGE